MTSFSTTMPLCPITLEPMVDPVIDREGNTYEKSAIMDWLANNSESPITRSPLTANDLVPNRALIDAIKNSSIPSAPPLDEFNLRPCSCCGKTMRVPNNYKGKKNPTCFGCRPWACSACTYSNNAQRTTCVMCDATRVI